MKLLDACGKKLDAALTEDELTDILLEMNDSNVTFNLADNKLLLLLLKGIFFQRNMLMYIIHC